MSNSKTDHPPAPLNLCECGQEPKRQAERGWPPRCWVACACGAQSRVYRSMIGAEMGWNSGSLEVYSPRGGA